MNITPHKPVPLPTIPGYELEAEIGRGGMGVVYRGRRQSDGRLLAVKMILLTDRPTAQELIRFRLEAESLACLNHPNVVKVREIGVCAGSPYIAIDFAENGTLKQFIDGRPQAPPRSAELARTLASALHHAHRRGMLHRDLKPANVLMMADEVPVLTDFGLVKFADPVNRATRHMTIRVPPEEQWYTHVHAAELASLYRQPSVPDDVDPAARVQAAMKECAARTGLPTDSSTVLRVEEFVRTAAAAVRRPDDAPAYHLTQTGAVMGSPLYMAPEQASGRIDRLGPPTDVYGLGGILYELLTGRPPFQLEPDRGLWSLIDRVVKDPPPPPRVFAARIARDLEAITLKCLSKSPADRYQTMTDLADDLTNFLEGYAVTAEPVRNAVPPQPLIAGPQTAGSEPITEPDTLTRAADPPKPIPDTATRPRISQRPTGEKTRTWWPFGRR